MGVKTGVPTNVGTPVLFVMSRTTDSRLTYEAWKNLGFLKSTYPKEGKDFLRGYVQALNDVLQVQAKLEVAIDMEVIKSSGRILRELRGAVDREIDKRGNT